MKRILPIIFLAPMLAHAGPEIGYAVSNEVVRPGDLSSARGFQARFNVGGGVNERYSDDRWAFTVGYSPPREVVGDHWIKVPYRDVYEEGGEAKFVPGYSYASVDHRWYTKAGRFKWAHRLRAYVGTGVEWDDAETCARVYTEKGPEDRCWKGTALVSSRLRFHVVAGFKWRERVELDLGHGSTGGISMRNNGNNKLSFAIMAFLGIPGERQR